MLTKLFLLGCCVFSATEAAVLHECFTFKDSVRPLDSNLTISISGANTSVLIYNVQDVPKTNIPFFPSHQSIQDKTNGFGVCNSKAHQAGLCSTPGEFLLRGDNDAIISSLIINKYLTNNQSVDYHVGKGGFYCFIAYQESETDKLVEGTVDVKEIHPHGALSLFQNRRLRNLSLVQMLSGIFTVYPFVYFICSTFRSVFGFDWGPKNPPLVGIFGKEFLIINFGSFWRLSVQNYPYDLFFFTSLSSIINQMFMFSELLQLISCYPGAVGDEDFSSREHSIALVFFLLHGFISGILYDYHISSHFILVLHYFLELINPLFWIYWLILINKLVNLRVSFLNRLNTARINYISRRYKASATLIIWTIGLSKLYSYLTYFYLNHIAPSDQFTTGGLDEFLRKAHIDYEWELLEHYYSFIHSIWWKSFLVHLNDCSPLFVSSSIFLIWINYHGNFRDEAQNAVLEVLRRSNEAATLNEPDPIANSSELLPMKQN